ncbi:spore coat protein F-like protein YhcQ [Thalassobacillus devorans]|uniref:Spore coat protein F-like protein YhcQ n=1 Tax=Thalassobacillus devorans TaxID=279813 RepID=A0ABQ1PQ64_9BACI|nr:spore coat protein [Thalassobacillus devorans]NIK30367.1 spore coat protein CotF [Thalassobacillus devorans]GGD00823.1 spore coat protein F-like protein YhcQ [Thalassobacillus devorans]
MQNQNPMNQPQTNGTQQVSANMAPNMSHGGHELFDAHEVIGGVIGMLNQYKMYEQNVQDPELKDILTRQANFTTELYNIMTESFKTGQKPSQSTHVYNMTQDNDVVYGMQPGQPKKPAQNPSELTDAEYSSFMLGQVKGLASTMAMTALEMTNPVIRRVVADSVPNMVEMSYELFLYQNKHGYYQVPQLAQQDMNQMLQSYSPAPQQPLN